MIKPREKTVDNWIYITIFCIIYFSKDTLLFGTNIDSRFALILYVSLPLMIIALFAYGVIIRAKIQKNMWFITGGLCLLALTTQVVTERSINLKYIYECLMYILAFLVCTVIPVEKFKKAFVDIIAFLALFSVIMFAVKYAIPSIVNFLPTITNTAWQRYGFAGFAVIPHDRAYVTFRNYGIFREPGVYQGFLNLALVFLMHDSKGVRDWKLYSLLLALIFTFSTAGYIILGAIGVIYVFSHKKKKSIKTGAVIAFGLLLLLYLFSEGVIRYDSATLSKLFTSNTSVNSRKGSFVVDIFMGIKKPLFGNGFEYVEQNFAYIAFEHFGMPYLSNTNTILKLFAVHGVTVPVIVAIGMLYFFKKNIKTTWFLYALLMFAILSNEDLIFNTTTYIFMMYGFVQSEDNVCENITD